jgi:sugar-specific transcriptional regulator TrmB
LKGTQVARQIKKDKAQVYHILKSLQAKGLVESTLEAPVRFVSVPFEKVVESTIMAKREEAESLENARKELVENWKRIIKHVPEIQQEKLVTIEGTQRIYSKMLMMLKETKNQFSASILPVLSRSEQFGILDAVFHHPLKSRVEFKFITELTKETLVTVRHTLNQADLAGINLQGRTSELGLKPYPQMVIKDGEEAVFFIKSQSDLPLAEQDKTRLWTDSKSLVQAFQRLFDESWDNSRDLREEIKWHDEELYS